ncbi:MULTISPECIES: 23S rRNA (uridine(2552)-2'-O)-methyltransferase RlmE [Marisediminitalea]|jgi:23S rRNA (uridine2552-2'-O)-methyltransferase|uniref:23S rRNA (uridine(2552)-2'-O)-methyltransferase RlmE n=1 Tax=Marisediminitalea TaxID=2662254 RepID=UPI000C439449|nr:23S rRNA (uridine(2552)-2'-O)-methyltransferase RlmE [Marisediminitalea aggregata]MAP20785.1 23S rRNA (uridine(2552)-2'-O)-methyltransferase RlmE [Alteromonadaceae bacterium]MCP3865924.1 23S rRNA (uridine(2552)-2'-O)-methyltransferase RlmE [Aestuariibacter sp.]MEC7452016.1 23S rRNA (uridine(2552)-2'-O)-methyltransferase RlmE [Pseudomonadota bacterium]BBO27299.1 ribosomal RNA large subunit methyltransferase E [Alteromonas sp. I4]HBY40603.1 23S rRNA (uridine(2552)-2'-O)-methyltransferase RlmE|tara:strand:- start:329 stop:949 length:621 start_codon:yes stop_codon:yes gene_type:complete
MAKSKTSKKWMDEHVNDIYVKKAQVDGYRSRASYKLIEINEKDNLFRAGSVVMDLGSAPGGWSQIVAPIVGDSGRVIASDILPMSGIVGVDFIQGDFTDEAVYDQILQTLGDDQVDTVVSDMAPNMSGVNTTDQYASMYLVELALDMARNVLKPGGSFCAKVFQGVGYDEYVKDVRSSFNKVIVRKPAASRPRSREVYLVAKGFKG